MEHRNKLLTPPPGHAPLMRRRAFVNALPVRPDPRLHAPLMRRVLPMPVLPHNYLTRVVQAAKGLMRALTEAPVLAPLEAATRLLAQALAGVP